MRSPRPAGTGPAAPPEDGVLVLRLLAERVEPALALLGRVWAAWRREAWGLAPCAPRIWAT